MATDVLRSTGQPISSNNQMQDFNQVQTTGPSTTHTTGTQTQTGNTNQTAISNNYALNTTPAAKAALEQLIAQLSDRPVISAEDAQSKFPTAIRQFDRTSGWYYVNPQTGMAMSNAEAELFNKEQQSKQQIYVQSGGMVSGGTIEQQVLQKERMNEIERNRITQDKYSKEAAFADAQGLSSYFARVLTEQQMPGILRGAEGSGASQGSTRALLTNDAIARNTEVATKTGLEIAGKYGDINVGLAGILEDLTKNDPNSIANQLLQALNIAKGIETSSQGVTNTDTNQVTNTTSNTVANTSGNTVTTNRDVQPGNSSNNGAPYQVNTPATAYTPSSSAGTGYVIKNVAPGEVSDPYQDTNFISYGSDDSNVIFED